MQIKITDREGVMLKLVSLALVLIAGNAVAGGLTLGDMAASITSSFSQVTKLITAGAYLAGLGFSVGAIIQFKAHKDAPQQTPIGKPIALIFIAAALLFLPTILDIAGDTMFSGQGTTAGPTGTIYGA
ncbi:MAG TPA: type IV secretion protein IcmD [Legionella sp.]|nr:type IV secretion protein IcmD [Legionella sp.]